MEELFEKEENKLIINKRISKDVFIKTINKELGLYHNCSEMILVEDNPTILKKYEKYLLKHEIKYRSFINGNLCWN